MKFPISNPTRVVFIPAMPMLFQGNTILADPVLLVFPCTLCTNCTTKIYMTVFWKTDHLRTRTEIHLLPIHDRHAHTLSKIPNTRQQIAWSAFTDSFLLILLNHKCVFHGPGWH